ncbi:MAG TPA: AraC family ligand binding domain-containing protein, partial [Saprospiraceae bacterium]|nr:AraC family ligand binding domain-containing protein [Saprospiraceae bacterium]
METLHHTLQDFFRSVGLPLQQDMDLTVHRLAGLHGDKPLSSPLFRTNYYSFLLIQKGKGHYTIDNRQFELGAGSFYFTNPGHLKSFAIEELLEGYMLTFSENFVKQHYTGDFYTLYPFLMHETSPVMELDEAILAELSFIFEQMLREYNGQAMFKGPILTKYLAILLYKTKELLQTHKASSNVQNRGAVLAGDFKKLLNENFRELATGRVNKIHSVKEFAERLNVHPNYLTNVVKDETGKPASEWIQERTL